MCTLSQLLYAAGLLTLCVITMLLVVSDHYRVASGSRVAIGVCTP